MRLTDNYGYGNNLGCIFITPSVSFYISFTTEEERRFWNENQEKILDAFIKENTKYETFSDFCSAANWQPKYNFLRKKIVYSFKDFMLKKKMKDLYYTSNFRDKLTKFMNLKLREYQAGFEEIIL